MGEVELWIKGLFLFRKVKRYACLSYLKCLTVFVFVLVFEHRKVAVVATFGNVMLFQSFENGAAWFVCMGAVVEPTRFRELENFAEVACEFFLVDVESAKSFNARCVYDVASVGQLQHFTECCGVHSSIVRVRNFCSTQVGVGQQTVDNGRFANAAVAAQQCNFVFE